MRHYYIVKIYEEGRLATDTFYITTFIQNSDDAKDVYDKLCTAVGDELEKLGKRRTEQFTFQKL